MNLRKIKQDTLRFIGNYLLFGAINVLCKTLRITFENKNVIDELELRGNKFVLAFWHGTMLVPWYLQRGKSLAALTSKSKDGDLLAKILKSWRYQVVRGSSHIGGEVALGIMVDYAKNNSSIAITPDGPTGPLHKMKAGAIITAKKSGLPVVLMGIGYKRKVELNSWDHFQIPKFFTRVKVIYSEPVYVDKNLSYDETSKIISEYEKKLNDIQESAGSFV